MNVSHEVVSMASKDTKSPSSCPFFLEIAWRALGPDGPLPAIMAWRGPVAQVVRAHA